jgi:hypothetical protein
LYLQDPYSSNTTVAETYGWPIGSWCVQLQDQENTTVTKEQQLIQAQLPDADLSGWNRPCDCVNDNGDDDERQEYETSTPLRGASTSNSVNGGGDGVTYVMGTKNTDTFNSHDSKGNNSNSPTTSSSSDAFPILYRLIPLKLMACLLLISAVFAVRHMVDFHRYEGIDPSDQKIAEFELLQLAEEG